MSTTLTRCAVLDANVNEGTFNLHADAGLYDVKMTAFTSDKSIDEQNLIWRSRGTSAYTEDLREVAYAPSLGLFAAVAASGTGNRVITSPDGITWTSRVSADDSTWNSITWSENVGAFVAVANSGTNRVMRSIDGINWTTETISAFAWRDVKFTPQLGRYFAVCNNGTTGRVASSPDGVTWTLLTTDTTTGWRGVGYSPTLGTGQGRLVVIGDNATTNDRVMYSDDAGASWTLAQITLNKQWVRVVWSPVVNRFVAVADSGSSSDIAYSDDGITWSITNTPVNHRSLGAVWVDDLNLFVIANRVATGSGAFTSPDGITWTGTNTLGYAFGVTWGAGKLILVGNGGAIFTSYLGHEQKAVRLELDGLDTGDSQHDILISESFNWNRVSINYMTTFLPNRISYRIRKLETNAPFNRRFLLVFELKKNVS